MHATRRDPDNHRTIAAIAHLFAAQFAREQYSRIMLKAFEDYGDGNGVDVSGIVRGHFPEPIKDQLRAYARLIGEETEIASEYWRKAGRRSETFRPVAEQFRQLANGRISYY